MRYIISTKKLALAVLGVIFLFVIYSAFVFRTLNPVKAFDVCKVIAIDNNDINVIERAAYAGGEPNMGYVFSCYDNTPIEAMDKIGFHDIGHEYFDGNTLQPEYCTAECGQHAIIEGRILYLGGYLFKYRVAGEA